MRVFRCFRPHQTSLLILAAAACCCLIVAFHLQSDSYLLIKIAGEFYRQQTVSPAEGLQLALLSKLAPDVSDQPGYSWLSDSDLSRQGNIYLEAYKLHYCKIDKNMGSTMQAVCCYIDNQTAHDAFFHVGRWGPGLGGTQCGVSTSYGDLRKRFLAAANGIFDENNGIRHITIIRDPVKRFLSAWLDVCSGIKFKSAPCFECMGNLTCFIVNNYYHIRDHATKRTPKKWHREWHFYPQSWFCDFDNRLSRYQIVRYDSSTLINEIMSVFAESGVDKQLVGEVNNTLRSKKAFHATGGKSEFYLQLILNTPSLLSILHKTYYNDFLWFNYTINSTFAR